MIKKLENFPLLWQVFFPLLHFASTQKVVTAFTGPIYERSRHYIEVDITYACNLKCFNCNRCCGLAPSDDRVSLEQIQKFLQESINKRIPWKRIRVLGGEPTLHPEFLRILDAILSFRDSQYLEVAIEVTTNGLGKQVNEVLKKVGNGVLLENTGKKSRKQKFRAFTIAPKDYAIYKYADYHRGCWIARNCGMGLSPYGYYPCAVAAAIDRVFGFDIGRKALPDLSDPMWDQMEVLCRYCGLFTSSMPFVSYKDLISESWRRALENYQVSKPRMTFY